MHTAHPVVLLLAASAATAGAAPLPERLSETGLFVAGSTAVRPAVLSYTPQYPLWSDGASKRRWLDLPPGTAIDAARVDAWEFPRGTRLWKEFRHGRPIETRFIERLEDGSWRYATYLWNEDASDAWLVPAAGNADHRVAGAPDGRYPVPSRDDCLACHEGAAVPVLGVSALQLSPDRDALAPHREMPGPQDIDLRTLAARGLLVNLPGSLLERAPRIDATSPRARAALGYLHANCGHCHNDSGPLLAVDLLLAQGAGMPADAVLDSLLDRPSDYRAYGRDTRVARGRPEASVLTLRMHSRSPLLQMPPLGTRLRDEAGIALIEHWIRHDTHTPQESLP